MVCLTQNCIGANTQYSIHALTDEAGAITEGYQYDAYGRQTVFTNSGTDATWFTNDDTQTISSASAVGNPYGYTGRRFDNETEIWYFRNRYYDGDTGRFLNRDPIGYVDGLSLYVSYFVIGSADPSGLIDSLTIISTPVDKIKTGWETIRIPNDTATKVTYAYFISKFTVSCSCVECPNPYKPGRQCSAYKSNPNYQVSCSVTLDSSIWFYEKFKEKIGVMRGMNEVGENVNVDKFAKGVWAHELLHHSGEISRWEEFAESINEQSNPCESKSDCEKRAESMEATIRAEKTKINKKESGHEQDGHGTPVDQKLDYETAVPFPENIKY